MEKKTQNYRGVYPAEVVCVLEGNGDDIPFEQVQYVLRFKQVGGISRAETVGKVVPLTEEEQKWFGV